MRTSFIAAIALLAAAATPRGQADSDHLSYDRHGAIEQALASNRELAAARLAVARAEARLEASGIAPNPSLELEYADDFAFGREGEGSFGIGISQRFPLARRLAKEKAASRVDIAKAKAEVRQRERELVATVCEFALDIQLINTRKSRLEELKASLGESAAFASEKARAGEISPLEANQIALDLRVLEQEIARLALDRERLIHRLAPFLGHASADHIEFRPDDGLPYEGAPLPGFEPETLERDPDFQMAVLEERAAEAEIALAEAENWEAVTASLFWRTERGIDEPTGRESDELIGVSLSVPLPIRKKGDLLAREKRIQREQSRLGAAAIKFRIQNDIEHARHEATILRTRMEAYETEVLALADDQLDQTRAAYRSGQTDMLALHRAQEQRLRLQSGYLDLREEYARALLELELARIDISALQ